ncbi:MAG: TolC family protein [Pseudobdellovibrionaceae bacterium]
MSCLKSSLFILLFTIPQMAPAQENLSFNQCIDLVKKNNAEIRASEETLQANIYQIDSVRGSYYPQISGSLGYLQSGPTSLAGSLTGTNYTATLNATENLFNGFADASRVEQAQAQARISNASLLITKAKVSFDLKTSLANFLYSKDAENVAREFQKRRLENLHMVELRFDSGRENKGSLLLSQAYLKQASSDLIKALHNQETSQSDLKKVLGIDNDEPLNINDSIPLKEPSTSQPDYRNIVTSAPNRRQSQAQVEVSEATLNAAKSGFYPTLNLTGSTGTFANQFFPDKEHWSVGLNLSWSFFGGGKDFYSTKSAASTLYAAKSSLTSLERDQLSVLKKAYTNYVEAVEDLKVNEAFLQAAKSRAEIARAKYNNGLLTFDEWDIIENDLIAKTKIYILSKRDRIISEATWEQAQGVGVIP